VSSRVVVRGGAAAAASRWRIRRSDMRVTFPPGEETTQDAVSPARR
jgi:hypothetical protein